MGRVALATLKHLEKLGGLTVNAKLRGLIGDEGLRGVIDHLVRLLDFSPSDLQRCATDADGHLVPRLRAVNSPVAIFIDGVDEYFNKHQPSSQGLEKDVRTEETVKPTQVQQTTDPYTERLKGI